MAQLMTHQGPERLLHQLQQLQSCIVHALMMTDGLTKKLASGNPARSQLEAGNVELVLQSILKCLHKYSARWLSI